MLLLLCQCGSKPRFCITFETNAQMKKTTKVRLIYALLMAQIVNRNGFLDENWLEESSS